MISFFTNLFKKPDVMLFDYDGEITFARSYYVGTHRFAIRQRTSLPIELLPEGKIRGSKYVTGWEELT